MEDGVTNVTDIEMSEMKPMDTERDRLIRIMNDPIENLIKMSQSYRSTGKP